jgi:hypothetical protein
VRERWPRAALVAAFAVVVALWRTGAHVVTTRAIAWRGLSDPPSVVGLAAAIAAGLALAWSLRRLPVASARPLLALGLAAAPLVPVLSGRLPLLLAFQGPALVIVGAMATAAALALLVASGAWRPPLPQPGGVRLFAAAFLFYAALGTRVPGPAGPQGDEPHYLAMTHSLLSDGDLDLAHEFAQREYRAFFAGRLEPHTSPASPPGRIYSIHTPGLSVLMLPAYAAFGYPGARLFLSALAALTAALVHRLVRDVTGSHGLALAVWAAVALTPPLPFYAVALYPETPAALATAIFLLSARRDPGPGAIVAATVAAAALPWLHPKFLPLAALGLGLTLVRRCPARARVLAVTAFAASIALLLAFFRAFYGHARLSAAYGPGFASDVSMAHIPWGTLALLLDRQFGLLFIAPLFLLAVPGVMLMARRRLGDALRALLLGGASLLVGASFSMWWGGACPPARFAIPAIPAFAVALAFGVKTRPVGAAALTGLGLAIVSIAAEAPRALHNRADGESGLLRVVAPALDLDPSLPSFVLGTTADLVLAATLAAAAALWWAGGRRGLLLGATAFGLVALGLRQAPLLDARRATLDLLEAWDPARLWRASGPKELSAFAVAFDLRDPPWDVVEGDVRVSGRIDVPPGLYHLDVVGRTEGLPRGSRSARVEAVAGELPLDWGHLQEGREGFSLPLLLPAGARRLCVRAVGVQGRAEVASAALVPEALVPRERRGDFPWPRQPEIATYRVGDDAVRTTALDRSGREGAGFRLEGGDGAFLVEAAPETSVDVQIERPRPDPADALVWNGHRMGLASAGSVRLRMTAADGARLGTTAVAPVELRSAGAWVRFSAAGP